MGAAASHWRVFAVWTARIIAGSTFIVSGWAKTVDPRGFAMKIHEYLQVWNFGDLMPDGMTAFVAAAISIFELCLGAMLLTGIMRRTTAIGATLLMAVMLPFSVYIFAADPVADCGCFGDLMRVSNLATMLKNIALTLLAVACLVWWKASPSPLVSSVKWLVPVLSVIYGIVVALIGWHIQPIVDFRSYPLGASLVQHTDSEPAIPNYVYSRDGVEQRFSLDQLPDSTWTFLRIESDDSADTHTDAVAVFDGDDEVTDELFGHDTPKQMIIMVFAHPGLDDLLRSRMANELSRYARNHNIAMIGLVGTSGSALEQWKELVRPAYDVFSADDTALKQIVRGSVGIVYMRDGRIVWKRNFSTLPADLLAHDNPLDSISIVDDGRVALWLTGAYIAGLALLLTISLMARKRRQQPDRQ